MASSSLPATCNGVDASSTANKDEEAMWNRLFQVELLILWNQLFQVIKGAGTQPIEEIVVKAATSSKGTSIPYSPRMCFFLRNILVSDGQRKWESRCSIHPMWVDKFSKVFWRCSNGISNDDLLLLLSKLAEYYAPSHEANNFEEFVLTNEERTMFLKDCSTLDKATRLAKDFNEFSLCQTHGQKPEYWTQRDHRLHSVSFFESMKPLEVIFPFSARFETAKECLDRLDFLKSITVDLNLDESDTLAFVLNSFKSPELQALHALKKEMELHGDVAHQLEQLSGKHLLAYEELSKDELGRHDEFFHTCQEEKRNVVQEVLYKKAKCLASIEKARICSQAKLSAEDLMKGIVQKIGSACKEVEGKLKKARSSKELWSEECTLCYSQFSKKWKRACLDPCGHAGACIDCATKAWVEKPYCPWCNASIRKPISIPTRIFI